MSAATLRRLAMVAGGALLSTAATPSSKAPDGWSGGVQRAPTPDCPALSGQALQGKAGQRKLALVVGVGDYLFTPGGRSVDLAGPPKDARRVRELLLDRGYPAENICMLLDGAATTANVDAAWDRHLLRAAAGDAVVFFFAGHGSQVSDWDKPGTDETDGLDETLMLHDSRMNADGTPYDLIDDRLNAMLARLVQKTKNITVLLDACNSGSATRDVAEGVSARQAVKLELPKPPGYESGKFGTYDPANMPGLLTITAARDGTSALEKGGEGVFTNALIYALREASGPLTYNQLTRSIPRFIASQNSFQVATFGGDAAAMNREVFGATVRERPVSWNVARPPEGGAVDFSGPAMPGWGVGATVAIYPGSLTRDELAKGAKPKAKARLTSASPFEARGDLVEGAGVTDQDIAVLEAPAKGPRSLKIKVAPDVPDRAGLVAMLRDDKRFVGSFELVDTGRYDFEVVKTASGLALWGDEGELRKRFTGSDPAAQRALLTNLDFHARQRTLLALESEPAGVYTNDQTLRLTLRPQASQDACPKSPFPAVANGGLFEVPLCTRTELVVELTQTPEKPLQVGVLYLANDGGIFVWPAGGESITLSAKGQSQVIKLGRASPPLGVPDHIVVFGTHQARDWYLMAVESARGLDLDEEPVDTGAPEPWTLSYLQVRNVGDPKLWTPTEMSDPNVCKVRKDNFVNSKTCP